MNNLISEEIEKKISQVEEIIFCGLKYPCGKEYTHEEDAREKKEASIYLTDAYKMLQDSGEVHPNFLERIYYLSRSIVKGNMDFEFSMSNTPKDVGDLIIKIAEAARNIEISAVLTNEERINNGQLFVADHKIFPVHLLDRKRGCSATICSNCHEPIAICYWECFCCKLQLVGPFGLPFIEEWQNLTLLTKTEFATHIYYSENHGKLKICEGSGFKKPVFRPCN